MVSSPSSVTFTSAPIATPSNKKLCGWVYAIFHLDSGNSVTELHNDNNIGADKVLLRCSNSGKRLID